MTDDALHRDLSEVAAAYRAIHGNWPRELRLDEARLAAFDGLVNRATFEADPRAPRITSTGAGGVVARGLGDVALGSAWDPELREQAEAWLSMLFAAATEKERADSLGAIPPSSLAELGFVLREGLLSWTFIAAGPALMVTSPSGTHLRGLRHHLALATGDDGRPIFIGCTLQKCYANGGREGLLHVVGWDTTVEGVVAATIDDIAMWRDSPEFPAGAQPVGTEWADLDARARELMTGEIDWPDPGDPVVVDEPSGFDDGPLSEIEYFHAVEPEGPPLHYEPTARATIAGLGLPFAPSAGLALDLWRAFDKGRVSPNEWDALVATGIVGPRDENGRSGLRGRPFESPSGMFVMSGDLAATLRRVKAKVPVVEDVDRGLFGGFAERMWARDVARSGEFTVSEIEELRKIGMLYPSDLV